MAHFLEHMVFKGSDRLEAGAFDLAIEALGGSSNAATGFDDVHFHVLIPPETSQQALDLLLDLVLHPARSIPMAAPSSGNAPACWPLTLKPCARSISAATEATIAVWPSVGRKRGS